jgi:hypothetical protein
MMIFLLFIAVLDSPNTTLQRKLAEVPVFIMSEGE